MTPEERKAVIEECAKDCDEWHDVYMGMAGEYIGWFGRKRASEYRLRAAGAKNCANSLRQLDEDKEN